MSRLHRLSDPTMGGPQPIDAAVVAASIPPGAAASALHSAAGKLEMEQ